MLERDLQFLDVKEWPQWLGSYNIAQGQRAPVVIASAQGNICTLMRFGLVPLLGKGVLPNYSTLNAEAEKIDTDPAWRGPWKRGQRCLVLASGFYEWQIQSDGATRLPYCIRPTNEETCAFAGLWDASAPEAGRINLSFAIITLPAGPLMTQINNSKKRQPSIMARECFDAWLSGDSDAAHAGLTQYPDDLLNAWPVSARVNSPHNNDARLIEPGAVVAPMRPADS